MRSNAILKFLAAGVLLALFPLVRQALDLPLFFLIFLYFMFFWIAQASSWNMLSGFSGYFSFGQGAFYGMGVYTTATLIDKVGIGLLPALPIAGILAALLGLGLGLIAFRGRRLQGELFALLTLAISLVLAAVARLNEFIDGGFGIPLGNPETPEFLGDYSTMLYRLGLVIMILTLFVSYTVYHSRLGKGLFAIRDDEGVAEGLGVPTYRYKMTIIGISTFFAGLSGGLHALQLNYVTIETVFTIRIPLFVILMSILGGRRHWMGPVLGAIVIFTLTDRFSSARLEFLNQIIIGTLLIVMILFVREGIYFRLRRRVRLSALIFVVALAITYFSGLVEGVITIASFATLATLLFLLIPDRAYARLISLVRAPVRVVPSGIDGS